MPLDTFDTAVLTRVINHPDMEPDAFLLRNFFRLTQEATAEHIKFDREQFKPRVAPFVSPRVPGKLVENLGYETSTFTPAYVKDKRVFDPKAAIKRAMGEQLAGSLSPAERMNLRVQQALRDQNGMLTRREEVMASEALRTGKVIVSGEGYPTTIVDFQRDASLTIDLLLNDRWSVDHEDSDPLGDLETWALLVQSTSGGIVTDYTMDPLAWGLFKKRLKARDEAALLFDYQRASASRAELAPQNSQKGQLVARIGNFNIWLYQDTYVDDSGVTQKMLPDYTVIGVAAGEIEGTRCYGMIQDHEANFEATRFFAKSWLEKDPSSRIMLAQSAPLVVPYRPNATICATVHS